MRSLRRTLVIEPLRCQRRPALSLGLRPWSLQPPAAEPRKDPARPCQPCHAHLRNSSGSVPGCGSPHAASMSPCPTPVPTRPPLPPHGRCWHRADLPSRHASFCVMLPETWSVDTLAWNTTPTPSGGLCRSPGTPVTRHSVPPGLHAAGSHGKDAAQGAPCSPSTRLLAEL